MPATTTPPQPSGSTSPSRKFNTLNALAGRSSMSSSTAETAKNARAGIRGFFDLNATAGETSLPSGGASTPASPTRRHDGKSTPRDQARALGSSTSKQPISGTPVHLAAGREDGPWSVSVADASKSAGPGQSSMEKRESRKKGRSSGLVMYTLYITTPTHNLTLSRSSHDITELDSRLREGMQPGAPSLPVLPNMPISTALPTSRKILQTISRTLSPGGHRSRAALGTLTSAGMNSIEGLPSPALSTPESETLGKGSTSAQSTTSKLAMYLTTVSNTAAVKKNKAWLRFLRVGPDDLESVRVERRVRKVRSDLAKHVKTSVAPANTNVAVTPSQSDIGEEGGRTDDDRSFSGRSTSHSYRQEDVGSRGASVDTDRSTKANISTVASGEERDAPSRKPTSFAGIPEEMERGPSSEGDMSKSKPSAVSVSKKMSSKHRERRKRGQSDSEKVTVDDFDMIRVLGKGCAGKVLLVRHKPSKGLFAMKSIHKRHVLAHQELQHTLTEQAVLKRMARDVTDPFVVKLWWSFHDPTNLYLIMDFHPGGDLATQLSRWGRLGRDRARFYAAEIVEGVEGLHKAGVIYRDLKPENVLIGVDGHIVLSDFGLSKEFSERARGSNTGTGSSTPPPGSPSAGNVGRKGSAGHLSSAQWGSSSEVQTNSKRDDGKSESRRWADERDVTSTFCGTAEYLAPEVIQGGAYSYEVDWWSFGTMLYEMLTGITPFWADTHADMYVRVLHDELVFPEDRALDQDTKSILRGLLQRNPMLRMKEPRIKRHPYFSMIEWDHVFHKRYIPPYVPPINPLDETDTQNFDETFLDMKPVIDGDDDDEDEAIADEDDRDNKGRVDATGGASAAKDRGQKKDAQGAQSPAQEVDVIMAHRAAGDNKSLFDGYSFRGRRDSESAQSTALSTSAPSESIPEAPPVVSADTSLTGPIEPSSTPTAIATKSAIAEPVVYKPQYEDDDDEDDDSAARAAVAALDHLERQAAIDEAALLKPETTTSKDHPSVHAELSATENPAVDNPSPPVIRPKAIRKASGAALPATQVKGEVEDDWDLIDAPTSSEVAPSEANGGKGQNLFSRGVVDTYRLLRRQESTRLPTNTPYTTKPFTRISRRNLRMPRPGGSVGKAGNGMSHTDVTSTAPANSSSLSLSARSASEGHSDPVSAAPPSQGAGADTTTTSTTSPVPESAEDLKIQDQQLTQQQPQRGKKMKRFTNFFEVSTR